MIGQEFYPTPPKLISRMLAGIQWAEVRTFLEPEAGKADIALAVAKRLDFEARRHRYRDPDAPIDTSAIDCIEIDPTLRNTLKGAGFRVVHDDFLTYETRKQYDLIVMNPPFSDGASHLMKALELARYGGIVRCLLNAETIRNPYSNERKALVRKLEELGAEIDFLPGQFSQAERPTDVEVALIRVTVPDSLPDSIILEDLRQAQKIEEKKQAPTEIAPGDFVEAIVARYRFETDAGIRLIQEYKRIEPHLIKSLRGDRPYPILELSIDDKKAGGNNIVNDYVRLTRLKYWRALFEAPEFTGQLTSNLQHELSAKVEALADYEFSRTNILSIQRDLSEQTIKSIEETIIALFEKLSHKHYWDETARNVHYFDGWATNKAWKINEKVIIPQSVWDSTMGRWYYWRLGSELVDLEKCLTFLNGGLPPEIGISAALTRAAEVGQSADIKTSFFSVTFYKKGTAHIRFTRRDLLDRLNIFGAQRKSWLPPSYGKQAYEDFNESARAVIDSFQGRAAYARVAENPAAYIIEPSGLLQLGGVVARAA